MQGLVVEVTLLFTRYENSSQNLGCSKHLPLTHDSPKRKFIDNIIINVTSQQSVLNRLKHLFYLDKTPAEACSRNKTSFP